MKILSSFRYALGPAVHAFGMACSFFLTWIILYYLNENKLDMLMGFGAAFFASHYTDMSILNMFHYNKIKNLRPSLLKNNTVKLLSFPIYIIVYTAFISGLNVFTKRGWSVEVGFVAGVVIPFLLHTFMLKTLPWRWRPDKQDM